ncbi:MAG: hypothetical protein ACJA0U_002163 [Salibacteraceae bacterium]
MNKLWKNNNDNTKGIIPVNTSITGAGKNQAPLKVIKETEKQT